MLMLQNHEDNFEKNVQGHVSTALFQSDKDTHTHTNRGMCAHAHCLAAPGLLRNRIDGARGPDCECLCHSVSVCAFMCVNAKHLQQ